MISNPKRFCAASTPAAQVAGRFSFHLLPNCPGYSKYLAGWWVTGVASQHGDDKTHGE